MPFGLGIWELIILAGVLVLLFGAKGAPAVARRLGTGVREVKDAVGEIDPRKMLEAGDKPAGKANAAPAQRPAAPAKPVSAPVEQAAADPSEDDAAA